MEKLSSKQIRKMWLDFWESKGHEKIASKSLIPINDPSLLWINSGVATLKDYFSGKKKPTNPRITSSQKSIRTNDIENVGITSRHHTLFEMLGNFSIGDYFKKDALAWAYELLFDVFKFDKDKIYITYFEDDKKTYNYWIELGIEPSHLISGDKSMNFWDVGQGPCGPDTEIFYDRGERYDPQKVGLKLLKEDLENDRYIEIWNIVFSQLNNDGENNYSELTQKNIDTGAGLERIVSIFQDAPTNFDTDLFLPIIHEVEKITGSKYIINNYFVKDEKQTKINRDFRIIADHIRAIVHAIQDGAKPSNTSRGYIIRRLLRRAYRSGLKLSKNNEFSLTPLTKVVADIFDFFEINITEVNKVIQKEEKAFAKTIKQGEELLNKSIQNKKELDFSIAFKLFETYGFPIELTQEILEEKGIKLDISKFDEYLENHAKASKGNISGSAMDSQIQVIQKIDSLRSKFIGYQVTSGESNIIFSQEENNKVYTLVEKTPFYPTGGGQEKDKGTINDIEVENVFKDKYGNIWHVTSTSVPGSVAKLNVNKDIRLAKERTHSATHLLGAALREVFGTSLVQLGSYNDEHKLRFDFPTEKKPSEKQINEVEKLVNLYIDTNYPRKYIETTFDEAKKLGAIALENEDYGKEVRVVDFGISKEFCGGTHVLSTKLIEKFKITKVETKGSGVFRIEAIVSNKLVDKYIFEENQKLIQELTKIIDKNKKIDKNYSLDYQENAKSIKEAIIVAKLDNKKLNKKSKEVSIDFESIKIAEVDGIPTYKNLDENPSVVKTKAIALREKFPETLIIIGAKTGSGMLVAFASKTYDANIELKKRYPGVKGGGSKEFAMGSVNE